VGQQRRSLGKLDTFHPSHFSFHHHHLILSESIFAPTIWLLQTELEQTQLLAEHEKHGKLEEVVQPTVVNKIDPLRRNET
jgi:hypothetical protein